MIEITIDKGELHTLELKLLALKGEKITPLLANAARRAATHAKEIGKSRIRAIYTIDSSSITEAIMMGGGASGVRVNGIGATLHIKGKRKGLNHYKAKQNSHGVFASIKKGSGNVISDSFSYNGTFFQREGSRLPIRRLVGLAVPQLFQNPNVLVEMQKGALEMYEKRVARELDRIIGG